MIEESSLLKSKQKRKLVFALRIREGIEASAKDVAQEESFMRALVPIVNRMKNSSILKKNEFQLLAETKTVSRNSV